MIYEENQMRERIHKLMHREGITQREFAKRIGRIPSNVSLILNGERRIPRNFTNDVLKAFPGIRRDWLVFGEGMMYEHEERKVYDIPTDTRPRLPKNVSCGPLDEYYRGEKRKLCQEKPIISQFSEYDFSIILKNDRMLPAYRPSDELFFKETEIYEWGNDYLIDTKEGPKFKKIFLYKDGDGKEFIRCVSYNKEKYPDFLIPRDKVIGYYKLVGVLRIL